MKRVAGQTIGPRAELVEEACLYGVINLQINNSKSFAEKAQEYFESSDITTEIVQEISEQSYSPAQHFEQLEIPTEQVAASSFQKRITEFLIRKDYQIDPTAPSLGWMTATKGTNLKALVHIIDCKSFMEMLSAISILTTQITMEVTSWNYDQALVFVNCPKKKFFKGQNHPGLLEKAIAAGESRVFLGL
ncbi:hypothetical protein VDF90_04210 [Xanthomonas campestris pv. raphani]|uniref:hypothetical protein n=1 Tax=Xanthomonas campestris TaxID=339 RepID=UPI002B226E14|nr:hypothetical protein [Xanthomonas campestris]MEA9786466.1 hypothetical protein [Xanthomonas campestris pv. raphani]